MTTMVEEARRAPIVEVKANGSRVAIVALLFCAVATATGAAMSWWLFHRPEAQWSELAKRLAPQWPFVVLGVSVAVVITLIAVAKLHAFVALVLAGFSAGLVARVGSLPTVAPGKSHWVQAAELTAAGLGATASTIAIAIGLAAVIGMCVLESGAADKIVRRFLAVFGEKRAGFALLLSTYVVSIPTFFTTVFMLLLPIAKAMRLRTGRHYMLYMMAICCAGVISHGLVIPHPGPLAVAGTLKISTGFAILAGLISGIVPMLVCWFLCRWIAWSTPVDLIEAAGESLAELRLVMEKPEHELPSLPASLAPILLPVVLIGLASTYEAVNKSWLSGIQRSGLSGWRAFAFDATRVVGGWSEFLGNINIALALATGVAVWVLMRQRKWTLSRAAEGMGKPIETAASMIFITCAGGGFGYVLNKAGVGDAVKALATEYQVNLILLAWLVATVLRIAQGSATVSMLTTAGVIAGMLKPDLPFHPIYLFLAIAYGATGFSWMNDGGFWLVSKLGGLTEKQTLRSWTLLLTAISIVGLGSTMLFAKLLPFASGPAAAITVAAPTTP